MADYLFTLEGPEGSGSEGEQVVLGLVHNVRSLKDAVEEMQDTFSPGETIIAYRLASGPRTVRLVEETVRRMELT